jgi:hypothetical protein
MISSDASISQHKGFKCLKFGRALEMQTVRQIEDASREELKCLSKSTINYNMNRLVNERRQPRVLYPLLKGSMGGGGPAF